ncbi:hypothetical protein [Paraherbaspirillum soli]|uniref:Uncharacterized protein n=1 Tax=Paraherbaspirillum soli TaxID=631222 RepID=A0ABW0M755_9BURK
MSNVHHSVHKPPLPPVHHQQNQRRASPPASPFTPKARPAASAAAAPAPTPATVRSATNAVPNKTALRRAGAQARAAAEDDGWGEDGPLMGEGLPLHQPNLPRQQQGQEQDGSDSADAGEVSSVAKAAALQEQGLELDTLADAILPMAGEHGIFELILGNGDSLGVVVNRMPNKTSLLLSPSSAALGEQLKRGRMELEGRLARRMGRDLDLTIL